MGQSGDGVLIALPPLSASRMVNPSRDGSPPPSTLVAQRLHHQTLEQGRVLRPRAEEPGTERVCAGVVVVHRSELAGRDCADDVGGREHAHQAVPSATKRRWTSAYSIWRAASRTSSSGATMYGRGVTMSRTEVSSIRPPTTWAIRCPFPLPRSGRRGRDHAHDRAGLVHDRRPETLPSASDTTTSATQAPPPMVLMLAA